MNVKILIADDEPLILKPLTKFLSSEGYQVEAVQDGAQAIEKFKYNHYDLLLTDMKMPNMSGLELIREIKKMNSDTMFIVMTGYGSIGNAIQVIKEGAFHYVTKPFDLEDIGMIISKALTHRSLEHENLLLRKQLQSSYGMDQIMGTSDGIKKVLNQVHQVSDTDSTVLLLGESGTGKELIAKALHQNSGRAHKPMVTVNCGAIPENLLESELFGHVKGAFTGAVSTKRGKFEVAHQGTIFLDEIGDMSLNLQVKILRVLQEKKFEPIGSNQTVEVDVRIIAATHQNLEELVEEGKFRQDLYYRLNVIPIRIPPLRFRSGDIPILIDHFLEKYAAKNETKKPIITNHILEVLTEYTWPGNIRELENTIERLCILKAGSRVSPNDLPKKFTQSQDSLFHHDHFQIPDAGISLKKAVSNFESSLILQALSKTGGNKNKAAHLLKLKRTTLVEKIKKKELHKVSEFV